MRLIDADALTKKFLNVCRTEFEIKNKCMADENVIALIHNAPTVLHDNYSMGYQDGVKKVLSERPQGEWIMNKISARGRNYTCTNCQKVSRSKSEFCQKCGADMRVKHELNNELNELEEAENEGLL